MIKTRKNIVGMALMALAILLFSSVFVPVSSAQQTDRAKTLGKRVKCMCGGCEDAAGLCTHGGGAFSGPCDSAKAKLKEIDDRVARGDSDDLILQSFVQEYGPSVLIEPPKSGFNLIAWVMPVLLPVLAFAMVCFAVWRWRQRAILMPASAGPSISPDMLARIRQQEDRDDDTRDEPGKR